MIFIFVKLGLGIVRFGLLFATAVINVCVCSCCAMCCSYLWGYVLVIPSFVMLELVFVRFRFYFAICFCLIFFALRLSMLRDVLFVSVGILLGDI